MSNRLLDDENILLAQNFKESPIRKSTSPKQIISLNNYEKENIHEEKWSPFKGQQ